MIINSGVLSSSFVFGDMISEETTADLFDALQSLLSFSIWYDRSWHFLHFHQNPCLSRRRKAEGMFVLWWNIYWRSHTPVPEIYRLKCAAIKGKWFNQHVEKDVKFTVMIRQFSIYQIMLLYNDQYHHSLENRRVCWSQIQQKRRITNKLACPLA